MGRWFSLRCVRCVLSAVAITGTCSGRSGVAGMLRAGGKGHGGCWVGSGRQCWRCRCALALPSHCLSLTFPLPFLDLTLYLTFPLPVLDLPTALALTFPLPVLDILWWAGGRPGGRGAGVRAERSLLAAFGRSRDRGAGGGWDCGLYTGRLLPVLRVRRLGGGRGGVVPSTRIRRQLLLPPANLVSDVFVLGTRRSSRTGRSGGGARAAATAGSGTPLPTHSFTSIRPRRPNGSRHSRRRWPASVLSRLSELLQYNVVRCVIVLCFGTRADLFRAPGLRCQTFKM